MTSAVGVEFAAEVATMSESQKAKSLFLDAIEKNSSGACSSFLDEVSVRQLHEFICSCSSRALIRPRRPKYTSRANACNCSTFSRPRRTRDRNGGSVR